jgi:hypothetical protein
MQNICHIFGTRSDLDLTVFLRPLSQEGLVLLDHAVVSAGGLDHVLALAVEVGE